MRAFFPVSSFLSKFAPFLIAALLHLIPRMIETALTQSMASSIK